MRPTCPDCLETLPGDGSCCDYCGWTWHGGGDDPRLKSQRSAEEIDAEIERRHLIREGNRPLRLYAADSPRRPGNQPKQGDKDWVIDLPLSDGRTLHLSIGQLGRDSLRMIFAEELIDDLDECRTDRTILLQSLRAIGRITRCNHTEDTDGWAKLPQCVEDILLHGAQAWMPAELVNDSGSYWWWNCDPDSGPVVVSVAKGFTGGEYLFAEMGQYGWNRAQMLTEMGGWWKLIPEPGVPAHLLQRET